MTRARRWTAALAAVLLLLAAAPAAAQQILSTPQQTLTLTRGGSILLVNPVNFERYAVGDPGVADVVVVSATEMIINGRTVGATSLILWDRQGAPRLYQVQVTPDVAGLERYLQNLMPGEPITVNANGNVVALSGTLNDPGSVSRAVEAARATGAVVIDNLIAPPAVQVLLQVRFAEINRTGSTDWSTIFSTLNPQDLDGDAADFFGQTVSDGLVRFLMSNDNANVQATIRAAIAKGDFRSLAEPNLLTLPGQEATFLAGGEFPYPSVQSGDATTGAVGITFKEFGVKLKFTPTLTRSGTIRLQVAPEVSSLDFANGLTTNGFEVPLVLTRRTETEVELAEGQYLVLAGLIDSETISSVTKIPLLGDIPLLGEFFKSKNAQSRQTELMVLITPRIVRASDRHPQLPTGEPETWKWPGWMREEMLESTTRRELNIPQAPPAGAQQEPRP
ncbi:MAG TPA: pilus assembly protein N-terminal domain-containing protein [Gemmatimonadales bacterium]|nr:pilus assembly protein N-terminal domain-containing protein [Gemmatimonadales bacterium]